MSGKIISLAPRSQSVFLILDGPDTDLAIYEVSGDREKYVLFRVMIGSYHHQPDCHSGYIEPLLPSGIHMRAMIVAACPERRYQNPHGIEIAAKILWVPNYLEQFRGEQFYVPRLATGRMIRMSYDLDSRTGGFAVKSDRLIVNSRSGLSRIHGQGTDDCYFIESDAVSRPTESELGPLCYYMDPYQDCF